MGTNSLPTPAFMLQALLVRRGGFRHLQDNEPDVQFHFDREKQVVVIRGLKAAVEKSVVRLHAMLFGGGVRSNGVRFSPFGSCCLRFSDNEAVVSYSFLHSD